MDSHAVYPHRVRECLFPATPLGSSSTLTVSSKLYSVSKYPHAEHKEVRGVINEKSCKYKRFKLQPKLKTAAFTSKAQAPHESLSR
jgi:hypothetical protein